MRLRPLLVTRVANSFPGLGICAVGLPVAADATVVWPVLAPVPVAAGIWLAIRGYRMEVVCSERAVLVRGYFRSRSIPCARIRHLELDTWPTLTWEDAAGRRRATTVLAFYHDAVVSFVAAHHVAQLKRLRAYINRNRR